MNRTALIAGAAAVLLVVVGAVAFAGPLGPTNAGPNVTESPAPTDTPAPQVEATLSTSERHSVPLAPASRDALVRGNTTLDAGSTLTLLVEDREGDTVAMKEATVLSDGSFGAVVDLHDVAPTTPLEAVVVHDDVEVTASRLRVTGPNGTHLHVTGENVTVEAAANQTIRGATDLEPGTEIAVRARSSGSGQPFIKSQQVQVREDGTFAATFDFEGIEPGTTFEVTVHHGNDTVSRSGTVVAADA